MQPRFQMPPFEVGIRSRAFIEPFFDPKPLRQVLRRREPAKWFWCDMSDLFGEWVPDGWIDRCFDVMRDTPQHVHQVLTKRAERMRDYVVARFGRLVGAPEQIWLGISAEDQQRADERIPVLLQTPAAVRWVSAEPLLGPIALERLGQHWLGVATQRAGMNDGLSWCVVGGESGSGARRCDVTWIRDIVRQCRAAGSACFVKQLGAHVRWDGVQGGYLDGPSNVWPAGTCLPNDYHDGWLVELRDRKGGDPIEWPEDLRVREFPKAAA
jgi:protein gp37